MSWLFCLYMNLDTEILRILTLAGDKGLKTEKIARHVFNACNSMFAPLDYKDVHAYVTQYLIKNAKNRNSIIERADKHGIYRLNFKSKEIQQLMFQFGSSDDQVVGSSVPEKGENGLQDNSQDLSLSLF